MLCVAQAGREGGSSQSKALPGRNYCWLRPQAASHCAGCVPPHVQSYRHNISGCQLPECPAFYSASNVHHLLTCLSSSRSFSQNATFPYASIEFEANPSDLNPTAAPQDFVPCVSLGKQSKICRFLWLPPSQAPIDV